MRKRHGSPDPITNLTSPQGEVPAHPPDPPSSGRRLLAFQVVIVFAFAVLSAQIWRLQTAHGEEYRGQADRNRFRLLFTDSPRGVVYDRNGQLLVKNIPSFTISMVPADIPQEREGAVLERLSDLLALPISTEGYQSRAQDPFSEGSERARESPPGLKELLAEGRASPFEPIQVKANVSREVAFSVEESHFDLPGVVVEVDPVREYVEGALTTHAIGYVGRIPKERADDYLDDPTEDYAPDDRVGLTGVEAGFEHQLRGTKGTRYVEVDYLGREVRSIGSPIAPRPGDNLYLTLDLRLQGIALEVLQAALDRILADSGVVIAMDPRNGQVLALVSIPDYDANLFTHGISARDYAALSEDPLHPLVNHAISGQYPPGSIFKMITAAGALQDGALNSDTQFVCQGTMSIPDKYVAGRTWPFFCWLERGHGKLTISEAIAQSCDIFFYTAGGGLGDYGGLGPDRLAYYARAFGLGNPTGIELPGEAAGLVPDSDWKWKTYKELWLTGDTYNMAIGQGQVLVTPLQMLNVTAAVANGGVLYQPQLMRQVADSEGGIVQVFEPVEIQRVPVAPEHLALVRQGMLGAVTHGTAIQAYNPALLAGGKTGTAEYYGPRDGKGRLPTHAWYTCFAPVDDPQIALLVFVEGGGEGSQVAVPIAAEILNRYFELDAIEAPASTPQPQATFTALSATIQATPPPITPQGTRWFQARLVAVHEWSSDISSVIGTVIDREGNGMPGVQLTINGGGSPIVEPTTDASGRFQYDMLSAGASPVYNIRLLGIPESEELRLDVEPRKRYVVEFREVYR